jgi:hypothetical protein
LAVDQLEHVIMQWADHLLAVDEAVGEQAAARRADSRHCTQAAIV